MRVAILTNDDPARPRGGAGRIAGRQAELLEQAGFEVKIFCPSLAWLKWPLTRRLVHHLGDFGARRDLARQIGEWQPDILITHNLTGCGFGTPGGVANPKSKIQNPKIKWIHVLHDVQLFEPSGQLRDANKITAWQKIWSWLRRGALGKPDLVVSPTRWLLDQHLRRGFFNGAKIEVLPNPGPVVEDVKRQSHQPLRLLFVGRLTEDKGAVFLDRLMKMLGDGFELRRAMEHGPVDAGQVRRMMEEADVLLVPSQIEENQPNVILEAAASGLPAVASDKGGIKETLSGRGQVCGAGDLACWQSALEKLRDVDFYSQQSAAMRELAEEHDANKYAQRLVELVKSNL